MVRDILRRSTLEPPKSWIQEHQRSGTSQRRSSNTLILARCSRPWAIRRPSSTISERRSMAHEPTSWSAGRQATSPASLRSISPWFVPATSLLSWARPASVSASTTFCKRAQSDHPRRRRGMRPIRPRRSRISWRCASSLTSMKADLPPPADRRRQCLLRLVHGKSEIHCCCRSERSRSDTVRAGLDATQGGGRDRVRAKDVPTRSSRPAGGRCSAPHRSGRNVFRVLASGPPDARPIVKR